MLQKARAFYRKLPKSRRIALWTTPVLLLGIVWLIARRHRLPTEALPVITTTVEDGATLIHSREFEGLILDEKDAATKESGYDLYQFIFAKIDAFWTPTPADVARAERRMQNVFIIFSYDRKAVIPGIRFRDTRPSWETDYIYNRLPSYKRQYIGLTIGGKRYVLINCFRPCFDWDTQWQHKVFRVSDGEADFWRIFYDVDLDKCVDYDCNGWA